VTAHFSPVQLLSFSLSQEASRAGRHFSNFLSLSRVYISLFLQRESQPLLASLSAGEERD